MAPAAMEETKKLVVVIGKPGHFMGSVRHAWLLPRLDGSTEPGFINLATGKTNAKGCIDYLRDGTIRSDALLWMYRQNHPDVPVDGKRALALLEAFFAAIQEYRIGSVVSITYPEPWSFRIEKEAERTRRARPLPLP